MNALSELERIIEDARRFVPEILGIIIASDDGLPMAHTVSKSCNIQDPIIISGLISSATAMMKNVLSEFGDRGFKMVFAQGEEISILVGVVEDFYVGFIATANVKLGPLFMEFRRHSEKLRDMLREYKI